MEWISAHWGDLVFIYTLLVALASKIAALTPSPKDDHWLRWFRRWVDRFAWNVKHAKNLEGSEWD